jgi:adenosine deaminase
VVETLRPERIGHGILAAHDPELMAALASAAIVLEICPTSNLLTKALPDEAAIRQTFAPSWSTASPSRSPPTAPR